MFKQLTAFTGYLLNEFAFSVASPVNEAAFYNAYPENSENTVFSEGTENKED